MSNLWSKEQMLGFIEAYHGHECLWKVKSKDYCNKFVREKAYEDLVDFVKRFKADANKDSISKRIHNMRGSFRRELKKMEASKYSGTGSEIYMPKLWYFDSLCFLKDQEIPRATQSNMAGPQMDLSWSPGHDSSSKASDAMDTNLPHDSQSWTSDLVELPSPSSQVTEDDDTETSETPPSFEVHNSSQRNGMMSNNACASSAVEHRICNGPTPTTGVPTTRGSSAKKKRTQKDQLLMMACETLKDTSSPAHSKQDRFDSFGDVVAKTLREMPGRQYVYAQKLISDVMFAGELGNLSENSSFVTDHNQFFQRPEYRIFRSAQEQAHATEVYRDYDS